MRALRPLARVDGGAGPGRRFIGVRAEFKAGNMIEVRLSEAERVEPRRIGLLRNSEAQAQGLKNQKVCDRSEDDNHVFGVLGEAAIQKLLGLTHLPLTVNTFQRVGDVAGLEIKTRSRHDMDLLLHFGKRYDRNFVLVTTEDQRIFRVHGWIWGHDAAQERFIQTYSKKGQPPGPPAYFCPQKELNPINCVLDFPKLPVFD